MNPHPPIDRAREPVPLPPDVVAWLKAFALARMKGNVREK